MIKFLTNWEYFSEFCAVGLTVLALISVGGQTIVDKLKKKEKKQ